MLLVTFCCVANGWLFPDKHTFEPSTGTKTKLASSQGWEPQLDTEETLLNWSSKTLSIHDRNINCSYNYRRRNC